jgi:hypothetical protein
VNKIEAKKILTEAFATLTPKQQANLRWHAKQKTRVLCGKKWDLFAQKGAG